VRQTAGVPSEFMEEDSPHLGAPRSCPRQPHLTWVTAGEATALPTRQRASYQAKPLKLSILMAAYNEEITIARAIAEILNADCPCEIELIVIDDGSTDATPMLLSQVDDPRVTVHRQPTNQGKGAALLAAASLATGTYILPFDADLEYAAEDISRVLEPILKGRCEVVYGVRLFGCYTVYRSYLYAAGNRLLTRMANLLFNAHLSDLHTCMKLMPLVMLRSMDLREQGFGLDSEITARLLRQGIRPFEVPVSYYGRSRVEGKKITWRDAVTCARILLRVRMQGRSRRESANVLVGEGDNSGVMTAEPGSHLNGHASTSATATNSSPL